MAYHLVHVGKEVGLACHLFRLHRSKRELAQPATEGLAVQLFILAGGEVLQLPGLTVVHQNDLHLVAALLQATVQRHAFRPLRLYARAKIIAKRALQALLWQ